MKQALNTNPDSDSARAARESAERAVEGIDTQEPLEIDALKAAAYGAKVAGEYCDEIGDTYHSISALLNQAGSLATAMRDELDENTRAMDNMARKVNGLADRAESALEADTALIEQRVEDCLGRVSEMCEAVSSQERERSESFADEMRSIRRTTIAINGAIAAGLVIADIIVVDMCLGMTQEEVASGAEWATSHVLVLIVALVVCVGLSAWATSCHLKHKDWMTEVYRQADREAEEKWRDWYSKHR